MAGKSRPTATKKLMGEKNKDRINENEPQYSMNGVKPPYHLSAVAKKRWQELYAIVSASKVMTDADRDELASYCQSYANWVHAENKLRKEGHIKVTPNGFEMPSPWVKLARDAQSDMHKFGSEFGLTPASRTRISVAPNLKEKDPLEDFFEQCADEQGVR